MVASVPPTLQIESGRCAVGTWGRPSTKEQTLTELETGPDGPEGEMFVFRTEDGRVEVHFRPFNGSLWMTQSEIAILYDITVATVSRHLKKVYESGELTRAATVTHREKVGLEQGRQVARRIEQYNLEAILAVGYRVQGPRGIQFRNWATPLLKEFLVKGFVMNDERLKDPAGADYFNELLSRIREIRTSEARFYKQIRDIFATTSIDYVASDPGAAAVFAQIQNSLHFAITGNTAPEIIAMRADPQAPNMGLTSYKGTKVCKDDVRWAKNYLTEEELQRLNLLTSQFLEYAEGMAMRRREMRMADWVQKTSDFIQFNEYPVLAGKGSVSRSSAEELAFERYSIYKQVRDSETRGAEVAVEVADIRRIEQQILADRKRLNRPPA